MKIDFVSCRKLREITKDYNCNSSKKLSNEINKITLKEIRKSIIRAKLDDKMTLRPHHVYLGKLKYDDEYKLLKIKQITINESNFQFAYGYFNALNEKIIRLTLKAIERAKKNGRKTILPRDM